MHRRRTATTQKKETEEKVTGVWSKAFSRDAEWDKKSIGEAVHWMRQFVALVLGIIWGVIPLNGFIGNGSFVIANVIILFVYYNKFLQVDDEKLFGSRWDLVQEGFFSSYAIFLVFWIITFNALYVD